MCAQENRIKNTITFSPDTMEYLDLKCKEMSISRSVYIQILLNQDKKNNEMMEKMSDIPQIISEMKKMVEMQQTIETSHLLNK